MIAFEWYHWLIAAIGALAIGIGKTGVPGFGIFVVPVYALLTDDAVASAGWLLPLLIAADIFAVAYHRRHAQIPRLLELVPWVLVGIILGGVAMAVDRWWLHDTPWRSAGNILIGGIILTMVGLHVWRRLQKASPVSAGPGPAAGFGLAAGFTTLSRQRRGAGDEPLFPRQAISQRTIDRYGCVVLLGSER